jgi:hypothetical protein
MTCPSCAASVPPVAYFCHACGADLYPDSKDKRPRFAAKPDEPVASFAIVSSIMPQGAGTHPQTYRAAFTITLGAALVAALFGALPIGVIIAAFAIPVVYLVYLYDINLWEDSPIPVTALACVLTAVLAGAFTWLWVGWLPIRITLTGFSTGPNVVAILLIGLLAPIVGEVIRQIGPVILASRKAFDDYMDGVTFGIASGVAYSALDTLVRHWDLVTGGLVAIDPGQWAPLILLEGFVKPLIMGTASGLAAGEFSGLGKGYDGFSRRYGVGVAIAAGVNLIYGLGVYFLSFVQHPTLAICLQLLFGLMVLGPLLIRLRRALQIGLTEGALEAAARSPEFGGAGDPKAEIGFCPRCEMPVLTGAKHCSACGAATDEPVPAPEPKASKAGGPAAAGPATPAADVTPSPAEPAGPATPAPGEPEPVTPAAGLVLNLDMPAVAVEAPGVTPSPSAEGDQS